MRHNSGLYYCPPLVVWGGFGAMECSESDSEDEYEDSDSEDDHEVPVEAAAAVASAMQRWVRTGTCRTVANEPYTGLRKALASGQHGGSTMASRSKRDFLTLGVEPSTATPQLGKRNRVATKQFVPSQEPCINRKKKQPDPPEIDESWMQEKPSVPVQRSDKERDRRRRLKNSTNNQARARARADMRAGEVETLVGKAAEVFAEFSLKKRKQMAICMYVESRENGYSKQESYKIAAIAARKQFKTVRAWVKLWLTEDGFFTSCNSGTNTVRNNLCEPEVKAACVQWWLDHPPGRKGKPNLICTVQLH